jgi:hypothetical protein
MKLSEVVDRLIDLSGKISAYYDRELPKWHPHYPVAYPGEGEPPPPPEEQELRDFLTSLPDETLYRLMVLVAIARYQIGIDGIAGYYEEWENLVGPREQALTLLMHHKASLDDRLSSALEELQNHQIDVNQLPLPKTEVSRR